jgi:hypothetical protein
VGAYDVPVEGLGLEGEGQGVVKEGIEEIDGGFLHFWGPEGWDGGSVAVTPSNIQWDMEVKNGKICVH